MAGRERIASSKSKTNKCRFEIGMTLKFYYLNSYVFRSKMMKLKATILDEQQKLSFRQSAKSNRLRGSRGAKSGDRKDIFQERNAGLEERKKLDLADRTNLSSQDKITATLAAKVYMCPVFLALSFSFDAGSNIR